MIDHFFLHFLCCFFRDKDIKAEGLSIMATPELADFINNCSEIKVSSTGHYDLSKFTREHYLQFRHLFIEKRACNPLWLQNDKQNYKVMDLLLNTICLIMTKKVPSDANISKID